MIEMTFGVLPLRGRLGSTIFSPAAAALRSSVSGSVDLEALADELGELAEQVREWLGALLRAARAGDDRALAECCSELLDRFLAVDKAALALAEIALVQQGDLEALRAGLPEVSKPRLH